ncbi:MAG: hypothetical protein QG597_3405 [Actinomycetota bacterium]|nr:hypothetical protein [Actinomycetota bacterium]
MAVITESVFLSRCQFQLCGRRWAHESWEVMQTAALRGYILDRLEDPALWSDAQGPRVLSVAALAEAVRHDEAVQAGIEVLYGPDADRVRVLGALVADEAVPFLAALRYTDAGMRKRAEWEAVWELQRREDAGEDGLDILVPPKYTNKDFRKASYWSARGKLDVPKERFISYPGGELGADLSRDMRKFPVAVMKPARWWPWVLPVGGHHRRAVRSVASPRFRRGPG